MKLPRRTYTAYSIGLAVVWAVVLAVVAATGSSDKLHNVILIFLGFAISWCSGTIARVVYPPPAKWRRPVDVAS
ncbi:MAG TPA: hypothetical protein VIJ28_15635 [Chloroflexota bacterium]